MTTSSRAPTAAAVLALAAVTAALWPAAPAQEKAEAPPATQYEYKVLSLPDANEKAENELNKLGEDGWELTAAAGEVTARGAGANQGSAPIRTDVRAVLKRPRR